MFETEMIPAIHAFYQQHKCEYNQKLATQGKNILAKKAETLQ